MEAFLRLISNPSFIDIISTFGLAVVIVVYFIFIRDPKHIKFWQSKYDGLSKSYDQLSDHYQKLEASLHPEKREMSHEQATKICHLALDRDLYKLYYRICEKIDTEGVVDVNVFVEETILDTNETWSKFKSPFPRVPCITDLYGVYSNKGGKLKKEIEEIMNSNNNNEEKKGIIWNKLLKKTIGMKREFNEGLRKLDQGKTVEPFQEPENISEEP